MNRHYRTSCLLIGMTILVFCQSASGSGMEDSDANLSDRQYAEVPERTSVWRLEGLNDFMFDSDDQLTHGISFQLHFPASPSLDKSAGDRGLGTALAHRLLPHAEDLVFRRGLTIGQIMATPDNLETAEVVLDDTPYMGMLAVENSWIAFNDTRLDGFAATIGLVGEYSFAEEVQKASHSIADAASPNGWHNQLDTEPVVNLHFIKKRKLWSRPGFDASLASEISVGNFATGIDAGIEMRIGRTPGGFAYTPKPIGRGMAYDASIARQDGRSQIYGSLTMKAWAWAVFMPLQGNTFVDGNEWTENNTIEPKHIVGEMTVGFHYVKPRWGLHSTFTFATDNIEQSSLQPGLEVGNNFGHIMFELRFGD